MPCAKNADVSTRTELLRAGSEWEETECKADRRDQLACHAMPAETDGVVGGEGWRVGFTGLIGVEVNGQLGVASGAVHEVQREAGGLELGPQPLVPGVSRVVESLQLRKAR